MKRKRFAGPACGWKTSLAPGRWTRGYAVIPFLMFAGAGIGQAAANRPLPQVDPPRIGLQFSANPATAEFFRAHVFEEPLVPVGGEPTMAENAALAAALVGYAKRSGPDDFASLTEFLDHYPQSPWAASLLTDLGLEYYHTAHYSLALEAWREAWALAKNATEHKGRALADRTFGELIYMNARLGRMDQMQALLKDVEQRPVTGPATGRVTDARDALWNMHNRPEIAFRCGPLALRSIRLALGRDGSSDVEILKSASTQKGCSLPQVAELSRKMGLNYQMAFRLASKAESNQAQGEFIVPSVVHWKVGHYAALVRKMGNLYELQDPTFGNSTWATKEALEAETSGYFLVPPGELPAGWRKVDQAEGATVWGKGQTSSNDPQHITPDDLATGGCQGQGNGTGMAIPKVHMMDVNLNLTDRPVGYTPPVGPPVQLVMRYNQRDLFQPANFNYANFGGKWTSDWITYVTDTPSNALADVNIYIGGGGQRTFTGFNPNTQTFAYQQYDRTLLKRTGTNSYELLYGNGAKLVFAHPDGSIGSTRNVFMTQMMDPQGNAVGLTYDSNLRIVALTDAIGQVTTLTYCSDNPNDGSCFYLITKVTDPFGRFATLDYEDIFGFIRLKRITDAIGLTSTFIYNDITEFDSQGHIIGMIWTSFITTLVTPYGTNHFASDDMGIGGADNTRFVGITYPDGGSERVEYNQTNNVPQSDPPATVPTGVTTWNSFMPFRNTYYWDRIAFPSYPDYSKARLYHWLHTENGTSTSGCLESTRQPLENRVWYDYSGQGLPVFITSNTLPTHVGRVLDDGSTQLHTYAYNPFGHLTNSIDPIGRTFSYLYDTNGIDLLEARQTRSGKNERLFKGTYNSQHQPLTITDAASQTNMFTYNARGQVLTATNPRHETVTFTYDANGYLVTMDGPLPGTNDLITASYDAVGRVRTVTSVSGYTVTFDYDNLDRVTRATYPDGTFNQYTYDKLDLALFQDRAGRQTLLEHDTLRRLSKMTDPLGRATSLEWCRCGALKSLLDPLGRSTTWLTDVQGRLTAKRYGDGSQVSYFYENTTSRLRQVLDEKQQSAFLAYNADNTLRSVVHANAAVPTPNVSFRYDPDYRRLTSMTDGIGTTVYSYNPITGIPGLGAGLLNSVTGPIPNVTTTYSYDELGRPVATAINGVATALSYDPLGRVFSATNSLGSFAYGYDGSSSRVISEIFPNGGTTTLSYGNNLVDFALQQMTNVIGAAPISKFVYGHDTARSQITAWSQQAGSQPASLFSFGYDAANQLLSATVTNSGALLNAFAYSYDAAGNRLTELAAGTTATSTYNALNQLSSRANAAIGPRTNEWDAQNRLSASNAGSSRTEFGYDGLSRLAFIRELQNGAETSFRRFVWCSGRICEERDKSGAIVTKRFFSRGVKLETGPKAGAYYYTRDHLGSIRELTDAAGNVRARYAYDPFGRRTKVSGDVDADFGFAGMFFASEANLSITHFRAYDAELGRWLSRDPLRGAEFKQGPNLYAYVRNSPVNRIDPSGKAPVPNVFWYSVENSGGLGEGVENQLNSEIEQTAAETGESPAVQALREWGKELASRPESAEGSTCVLFADIATLSASTVIAAGVISLVAGFAIGTGLEDEFHFSRYFANTGVRVENFTSDLGFGDTTAKAAGGYATVEIVSNPVLWVFVPFLQ